MNPRRPTPRHITIKEPKVKVEERIYEVAKKEQRVIHKGTPIRLSDCSASTFLARKECHCTLVFKVLKEK